MKKTKKWVPVPAVVEHKNPFNDKANLARLDDLHVKLGNNPAWDAAYEFMTTHKCNHEFLMFLGEAVHAMNIYQSLIAFISHLKSFVEDGHMPLRLHEIRARANSCLYSITASNCFLHNCIELEYLNPNRMDRHSGIINAATQVYHWTSPLMEHLETMLTASDSELLAWIDSLDVWDDCRDDCYRIHVYLPRRLQPVK